MLLIIQALTHVVDKLPGLVEAVQDGWQVSVQSAAVVVRCAFPS
jgi:hypothetical protein